MVCVIDSSSCRCAFFTTSIFEISNSKFVVFQYVNKRVCPLPGNCFVVHGDVSLVEVTANENVREKSVIASKQKRTMICGGKSKYITNLGTRNYRVLHLAYNPRPAASGCMLGL